ncbi:MAG: IS5 family transposase, partial [Geminicoccaceae bacterium]
MARHDLTDFEWSIIEPLLPNKSRGVPRVDDRRVLNGIFWRFRTGSPWADIPERYGPHTTCYNRFVRWREAGIWDRLLSAMAEAVDGEIVMIDSSSVRVHQHAAGAKKKTEKGEEDGAMGRSKGGLTTKIHAVVDADGRPIRLGLTSGQTNDCKPALDLLTALENGAILLADKAYDTVAIRNFADQRQAWANIPPRRNRKGSFVFSKWVYRQRNLVERFFNKLKNYRGIATRYDRNPNNFLAAIKMIALRISIKIYE